MLHGAADEKKLRAAGLTFDVRVADLAAQSKADRTADAKCAASNPKTQLPSGSNLYRHLADYDLDAIRGAASGPPAGARARGS